jgi:hypothetical protein
MASPALTGDIESRWRTLTEAETAVAETRLEDAWRRLKRLVPDLETRMVGDEDLSADVVQVLADSVIRLLRVGDLAGYKRASLSIDDASRTYELSEDALAGGLYFTDDELESLLGSATSSRVRAYSVIPE